MATLKKVTSSFTSRSSSSSMSNADMRKLIEKKAFEIYQKRGASHGNDLNDWLQAEKLVKKEYNLK